MSITYGQNGSELKLLNLETYIYSFLKTWTYLIMSTWHFLRDMFSWLCMMFVFIYCLWLTNYTCESFLLRSLSFFWLRSFILELNLTCLWSHNNGFKYSSANTIKCNSPHFMLKILLKKRFHRNHNKWHINMIKYN